MTASEPIMLLVTTKSQVLALSVAVAAVPEIVIPVAANKVLAPAPVFRIWHRTAVPTGALPIAATILAADGVPSAAPAPEA